MKQASFIPVFVETIPEVLDEGRLYISLRYRTASHLCACGCGSRAVTPIKPTKWSVTYDGETVSLSPSIGRWQLPCKSHYWIRRNGVDWSRPFTDREIAAVQRRDAADLHEYYASRGGVSGPEQATPADSGMWSRIWRSITKKKV